MNPQRACFRTFLGTTLSLALLAPACAGSASDTENEAPGSFFADRFLNIAHRGGARLAPEETLEAYRRAVEAGADVLETDVRMTSDGGLVLIHDVDVKRTTDGEGPVRRMTLAEIRKLDAGYKFTRDGGETFPFRGQGVRVATLAEFLDAFPTMPMSIELKDTGDAFVDAVVAEVVSRGRLADIVFASFLDGVLQRIRSRHPTAHTTLSAGEMIEFLQADGRYEAPARFLQAPHADVDASLMKRAHAAGFIVHPWTVNKRDEMERLIDVGVHGIMTDDPVLLETVLVERGLRNR